MSAEDIHGRRAMGVLALRLDGLPVPIYGAALALLGLGLLMPLAWPSLTGHTLVHGVQWAGAGALVAALGAHTAKALVVPDTFLRDVGHAGVGPFFGQVGVALSLLCETLAEPMPEVSYLAFTVGSLVALLSVIHAAWLWIKHRLSWRDASPSWLLPGVQALYLGVLAVHQAPAWRADILAVGAALSIGALACLTLRAWNGPPWPIVVRPALAIGMVPSALGLIAVLQDDPFATWPASILFILTLSAFITALAFVPSARHHGFKVSWWAYGMPLAAAALSFQALYLSWDKPSWLAWLAQGASGVTVLLTLALSLLGLKAVHRFFSRPVFA